MRLAPRLPLLGKELVEQSARARTYVLRAACAVGMFGVFLAVFGREFESARLSVEGVLGRGRVMFETAVNIQMGAVFLLMPAMMAGAIAREKEQNSLAMLLLTGMKPRQIVLQKLLGRTVPMWTVMTLMLPVLTICYSFGGVDADYLMSGAYVSLLAALQVGALAMVCSALCATTARALLLTYVLMVPFYALIGGLTAGTVVPPVLFSFAQRAEFRAIALYSVSVWVSVLVLYALSCRFLVERAFAPPTRFGSKLPGELDTWLTPANHAAGDLHVVRKAAPLPGAQPVSWRESTKAWLGSRTRVVRAQILLEFIGLVFIAMSWGSGSLDRAGTPLVIGYFLLWGIAALAMIVRGAGLFADERAHQTLDLLLATPISTREIVRQKARGVWRLCQVFAPALLTLAFVQAYTRESFVTGEVNGGVYLLCGVPGVITVLPTFGALAIWVGLRRRTRSSAVLAALAVVAVWCIGPFVAAEALRGAGLSRMASCLVRLVSPLVLVSGMHLKEVGGMWAVFYLAHSAVGVLCWRRCLRGANRFLGRPDGVRVPEALPAELQVRGSIDHA